MVRRHHFPRPLRLRVAGTVRSSSCPGHPPPMLSLDRCSNASGNALHWYARRTKVRPVNDPPVVLFQRPTRLLAILNIQMSDIQ